MKTKGRKKKQIIDGKIRCSSCQEWKETALFYPSKTNHIGFSSACKSCNRKEKTERYKQTLPLREKKREEEREKRREEQKKRAEQRQKEQEERKKEKELEVKIEKQAYKLINRDVEHMNPELERYIENQNIQAREKQEILKQYGWVEKLGIINTEVVMGCLKVSFNNHYTAYFYPTFVLIDGKENKQDAFRKTIRQIHDYLNEKRKDLN